ncbi:hypothetical protein HBB16_12795 [Pseudonocardia sp. MCCB 268]|nr:hypothetical protein [Pseudonocardia cytotoxica]
MSRDRGRRSPGADPAFPFLGVHATAASTATFARRPERRPGDGREGYDWGGRSSRRELLQDPHLPGMLKVPNGTGATALRRGAALAVAQRPWS